MNGLAHDLNGALLLPSGPPPCGQALANVSKTANTKPSPSEPKGRRSSVEHKKASASSSPPRPSNNFAAALNNGPPAISRATIGLGARSKTAAWAAAEMRCGSAAAISESSKACHCKTSKPNNLLKPSVIARPASPLFNNSAWSGENMNETIARPTFAFPSSRSNEHNGVVVSRRNLLISCCAASASLQSSPTMMATTLLSNSSRPLGQSMTLACTSCCTVSSSMRPTPDNIAIASFSGNTESNNHFTAASRADTSGASALTTASSNVAVHSMSRSNFCATRAATLACGVAASLPPPRSDVEAAAVIASSRCVKPNSMARSGGKQRNKRKVSTPKAATWRKVSGLMSNAVRQASENCAQLSSRRWRQCLSRTSSCASLWCPGPVPWYIAEGSSKVPVMLSRGSECSRTSAMPAE
mmetsp:Transcript_129584/g.415482  ORF Transcript_129584/g.415482 Transcript_129584/m.415482 type:complete len:414 (-) Transcript_129584:2746-3987(-)